MKRESLGDANRGTFNCTIRLAKGVVALHELLYCVEVFQFPLALGRLTTPTDPRKSLPKKPLASYPLVAKISQFHAEDFT